MLSGVSIVLSGQLASQPGSSKTPITLRRGVGQAHDLRGLLDRQASKKAQLDNPAVLGIGRGELHQSVIERQQFYFSLVAKALSLAQGQTQLVAAAFCRQTFSRVVNQNVPHHLRCQTKELSAMLHRDTVLVGQA